MDDDAVHGDVLVWYPRGVLESELDSADFGPLEPCDIERNRTRMSDVEEPPSDDMYHSLEVRVTPPRSDSPEAHFSVGGFEFGRTTVSVNANLIERIRFDVPVGEAPSVAAELLAELRRDAASAADAIRESIWEV